MINLIRNEIKKIFKKKSLYITLIITLIFIIASNVIYKNQKNHYGYDVSSNIEYYEEQLKEMEKTGKTEDERYITYKSELEINKLVQNYGKTTDTWQARIIFDKVSGYIREKNYYLYQEKDEAKYEKANKEYQELVKKIDKGDWQYFAREELKEAEERMQNILKQGTDTNLANQQKTNDIESFKANSKEMVLSQNLEDEIYGLEIDKQILNWRLEKDIPYGRDYMNNCLENYRMAKSGIRDYEKLEDKENYNSKQEYYRNLEQVAINQYDIEHGTTSQNSSDARGLLLNIFDQFEIFILIMIIMIAGSIVSEEFNKGTIKLLLIKPYKRITILTAKFITCLIMLLVIIFLIMAMQFIVGGIVQGFDTFDTPAIVYNHNTNQLEEINIIKYLAIQTAGKLPIYILLMTLAFAFSTIFTNSALAITIGLLGYMGAPVVNALGIAYKLNWLKFFVTPNWDLTQYFFGGLPTFEGLTIGFSIAVIIAYMVIMLVPTGIIFKKKNIKNI